MHLQSFIPSSVRRHVVAAVRLATLLGPLAAHHAACGLTVCETYRLHQDETHERVTICPTGTLYTNGYTLTITGSGGLTCQSHGGQGGDLLINGTNGKVVLSGGGTHAIGLGGMIKLCSSSAVLRITGSSATVNGQGEIVGDDPAATICIDSGKTLTSTVPIKGSMIIDGPGTLYNKHEVRATENGTILLASDLRLKDEEGSDWIADGASLEFHHAQAGNDRLLGYILITGGGTLGVYASITTCGTFAWYIGILVLDDDVVFTYEGFAGPICPDPSSSTSPPSILPGPFSGCCLFPC